MSISIKKYGDWSRAGAVLRGIQVNLFPAFTAQITKDGDLILKTLQGHIDRQDLPWVPLSRKTIEMKNGNDTIYIETGWLRDNLSVRKIKSSKKDFSIFIGASPWKTHPSGVKFSDLMIWLEYGTNKIPPRPLIRPTWDEVEPVIKESWRGILEDVVKGG